MTPEQRAAYEAYLGKLIHAAHAWHEWLHPSGVTTQDDTGSSPPPPPPPPPPNQ